MTSQPHWRHLATQKYQECQDKIPLEWRLPEDFVSSLPPTLLDADIPRRSGILSDEELNITENYTARELLAKLADGSISSVLVTRAFSKRAAIAQQVTSCLTEIFFDKALERAEYLDEYLEKHGKPIGPLHGLPISLKDSFCLEGIQTTIGYVSYLGHPLPEKNSALVDILLDLGAVLYVKTNIPQTMMTAESHNNIFNRALNPHNTHLGAGGSSGGEGALIAFRGSILGVGTDVAGSIRIPALCNGVYGFRPTVDRIPYGGQAKRMWAGVPSIKACAGPLGHSLEDLEMFMRCVVGVDPWRYDVNALSMGWSGIQEERKLRIGVLPVDEHYPLHPPVRRALNKAVDELTRQGHTIVYLDDIPSRSLSLASRIAFQYFFYRPKDNAITASGEPEIPSVAKCWSPMFTGPAVAEENADPFTQISQLYTARLAYCEAWRDAWMQNGLDAVVAPGSQSTAVPHDTFGWPSYTAIWNVLDYPCCIIPYGKASKELDPEPMMVNDDQQPSYNPDEQDGAPTSIQVIARQFQDEKCLWAARIINNALNR